MSETECCGNCYWSYDESDWLVCALDSETVPRDQFCEEWQKKDERKRKI